MSRVEMFNIPSTSVHYVISVHVWRSTLLNLLRSVLLAHVFITTTVCSTAHFSATSTVSNMCRTNSVVWSFSIREWYMAYRIASIPMTLSNVKGRSPIARLLKWDISYSWQDFNWQRVAQSLCNNLTSCRDCSYACASIIVKYYWYLIPFRHIKKVWSNFRLHTTSVL